MFRSTKLLGDAKNAQRALPWYPGDLEKHLVPATECFSFAVPLKDNQSKRDTRAEPRRRDAR